MELLGNIKNYDWGKLGRTSTVAKLAIANDNHICIDDNLPYAELWIGSTHPSGPSILKETGIELNTAIPPLPFLFKVLSIRKPLSIQVHPNKQQAEILHKEQPELYKDPNHKPELAIALTQFLALCGFRPLKEIADFCYELPPLMEIVGEVNIENLLNKVRDKDDESYYLKKCYETLMRTKDEVIAKCIEDILNNYSNVLKNYNILDVFKTINENFPGDVGVLSLFFMNLMKLEPGQAIYLGANEIHAYLSGDCIECMACSDNVIRAGLTPKFKDVERLLASLKYESAEACSKIYAPYHIDQQVEIFIPPVDDFAVAHILLRKQVGETSDYKMEIPATDGILVVLSGSRKLLLKINKADESHEILLERGKIIYIPDEAAPEITFTPTGCKEDNEEDFVAYLALANTFRKT